MLTQVLSLYWVRGGDSIQKNVTVQADAAEDRSIPLTALQSNEEVNLSIDVSALKLLYISSDVDVQIETNNSSTPDDTLNVTAGQPLVWYEGCGLPNPFASATDVTKLFITNSDNAVGTVEVRVMQDGTP